MRIYKEQIEARQQQANYDNNSPDTSGNYMVFGERKECLRPTLLNQKREQLGYRPELQSSFHQCVTKRPRY